MKKQNKKEKNYEKKKKKNLPVEEQLQSIGQQHRNQHNRESHWQSTNMTMKNSKCPHDDSSNTRG
jgi:hypothetical protein